MHQFHKETQLSGETVCQFHTRLQLMAKLYEFTDQDLEIRRQGIQGCKLACLHRKAMEIELSLEALLKVVHAMETVEERTAEIE